MIEDFDLDKANAGKPIMLRTGEPVTFVGINKYASLNSILVVARKNGMLETRYISGKIANIQSDDAADDVVMAPEEMTVWVNFYTDWQHPDRFLCEAFSTERLANNMAKLDRICGKSHKVVIK